MNAAIYARKSTAQDNLADVEKSVARQIEHARSYAVRKGWTVLEDHVYVDDGISGAEFANRAGFVRLMNALKPRPPFQVLVMSEESRLGREAIETSYTLKQLLQANVQVWFYLEDRQRTLESATDKILLSVTAFADELEREKTRQRTYDALARKARAGHVTGGRTFGYENVPVLSADGRRSHVERRIVDAEASVVRRIFELAIAGYGKKAIARILNEDLAPAPRAQQGRPAAWVPASVGEVLGRELYRGVIVWNASRKRDAWGQKRQRPRDASEWMRIDKPELRIVSDELWTAAHARLERRRAAYLANTSGRSYGRPAAGKVSPYLLTGFMACGCCTGTMVIRTTPHRRVTHPRLECSCYQTRGLRGCVNHWQPALEALNTVVLDAIEQDLFAPAILNPAIARAVDLVLAEDSQVQTSAADAREQLADVEQQIRNLTAVAAAGAGDVAGLVQALRELEARRRGLTALTSRTQRQRTARNSRRALETQLRSRLDDWRDVLRSNVSDARPVLDALLVGRIVITPHLDAPRSAPIVDVRIPLTLSGVFETICGSGGGTSPAGFSASRTAFDVVRLAIAA